jgi:hypothetical protein
MAIAAGLVLGACNNSKTPDMKTRENNQSRPSYACPMHPEVTGNPGDKCPKCGMELVPAASNEPTENTVKLTTMPEEIDAGSPAELTFVFKNADRPIEMEIAHEKKLHLMVISDDLSWFRHIHPQEQKDGSYGISETFPFGGKYLLFADYTPAGGSQTLNKQQIAVNGAARKEDVFKSTKTVSEIDGYKVTLENGTDLHTSETQALKVSVERKGKKLSEKDIQKYLGATAHIVMIGQEDKDYLHIHPVSNDRYPIYAETLIKKSGAYRIWVEFKIGGKVRTADFTVNVAKGNAAVENHIENHGGHSH